MHQEENEKKTEEKKTGENEQKEEIRDMSAVEVKSGRSGLFCMSIIGEIEGHTILPPQSKTTKYVVLLCGGKMV